MNQEMFDNLKLEDFHDLDNYFEISSVDETDFLLREIRRKVTDKFEDVIEVLNSFMYPDTSNIMEITEANTFQSQDRDMIAEILQAFSIQVKMHQMLEVESQETGEREFVKSALAIYKENIPKIKQLILKAKNSYKITKIKETVHYLG